MKRITLIIILLFGIKAFCQLDSIEVYVFKYKEDSLSKLFNTMYASEKNNIKLDNNKEIARIFNEILINAETFEYGFDSLTAIGKITSPDGLLRIYSWNIPFKDGTNKNHAFIQLKQKKSKTCKVFELIENSNKIEHIEKSTLKQSEWYGSLIYEIIPTKNKSEKFYTILALDFNDLYTTKKMIDVLHFSDDYEEIFFGKPVFQTKKGVQSRIVFEYSSRVSMSLKYNTESKQIIFDHLSPIKPSLEGSYQFYGPDFSFDALSYNKEKWIYINDVNVTNEQ